ncbi:MAG: glycosyltransferase family 1 protein [Gammaproteobacteria bacterium]|nr:glycosyltransferase family 1 protein [Gammaproteobacteria bacterium]
MPYVELISRLIAQGHQVHFALRSLHKAHEIFQSSGVIWHQAPLVLPRHVDVVMPVDSYTKILHNAGYDRPDRLAGLIAAWRNLFVMIDPELIIFDYSPTAMLAARNSQAKTLAIGTGFHLPPNTKPIPGLHSGTVTPQNRSGLLAFEERVLGTINGALALTNEEPLAQFANLLNADKTILRTLPELDHYAGRSSARYAGIMKSPPGDAPVWPAHPGPKVFAYLKNFKTLDALLGILNQKRYPTLIYGDKIPEEIVQRYSSDTLVFVPRPLDMDAIGQTADVAICNAGHGVTTELLLSGVPLLLLPLYAEQNLVAHNVERLGAGLSAPHLHPGGMEHKLEALLHERSFRESAQKFSNSYRDTNAINLTDTVLQTINSLLASGKETASSMH